MANLNAIKLVTNAGKTVLGVPAKKGTGYACFLIQEGSVVRVFRGTKEQAYAEIGAELNQLGIIDHNAETGQTLYSVKDRSGKRLGYRVVEADGSKRDFTGTLEEAHRAIGKEKPVVRPKAA